MAKDPRGVDSMQIPGQGFLASPEPCNFLRLRSSYMLATVQWVRGRVSFYCSVTFHSSVYFFSCLTWKCCCIIGSKRVAFTFSFVYSFFLSFLIMMQLLVIHFNPICGKLKCVKFNGDTKNNNGKLSHNNFSNEPDMFLWSRLVQYFHSVFICPLCDIRHFITSMPYKKMPFWLLIPTMLSLMLSVKLTHAIAILTKKIRL